MFKRLLPILLLPALLLSTACLQEQEYFEPEPSESTLALTYISGHFGSYHSCPDEAFNPERPQGQASDQEGERRAGAPELAGDCADPCEGGGLLNCEAAQVTLRLSNEGEVDLRGIVVRDLLVLDADDFERASLPVLAATLIQGGAFDGNLAAGQSVDLRVEFRGPLDLGALISGEEGDEELRRRNEGARLRVFMRAEGQGDARLDTPEIYTMPEVAT